MINMTEQLVSKETAILAKEKGFTIITGNYYLDDEIITGWSLNGIPTCTQSLLQKWLRDVHNIDIDINSWKEIYKVLICKNKTLERFIEGFLTYEEALEKSLQEALKLINNNDISKNN